MKKVEPIGPIHPGETIKEDFLLPLGMTVSQLARSLRVDASRMNDIVRGRRGITADTALRLSRYFGTTADFWMRLQADFELRSAAGQKLASIERDVRPRTAA